MIRHFACEREYKTNGAFAELIKFSHDKAGINYPLPGQKIGIFAEIWIYCGDKTTKP
jgi:hypothetical protein